MMRPKIGECSACKKGPIRLVVLGVAGGPTFTDICEPCGREKAKQFYANNKKVSRRAVEKKEPTRTRPKQSGFYPTHEVEAILAKIPDGGKSEYVNAAIVAYEQTSIEERVLMLEQRMDGIGVSFSLLQEAVLLHKIRLDGAGL
jgi:hypothetical protein